MTNDSAVSNFEQGGIQQPVSDESNTKTAGEEAKAIVKRIFRLAPEQRKALESKETPRKIEIQSELKRCGFPQRHRENLKTMHGPGLEKAKELWPMIDKGDVLMILFGIRGPGKTQMATYWASRRIKQGKARNQYVKCADLFEEIRNTWGAGPKKDTEHDILEYYRRVPMLVIDEVHELAGSSTGNDKGDWARRTLVNILDHRYDARRITILIANYSEGELSKQINPSIISRAEETGCFVSCNWQSYRSSKIS